MSVIEKALTDRIGIRVYVSAQVNSVTISGPVTVTVYGATYDTVYYNSTARVFFFEVPAPQKIETASTFAWIILGALLIGAAYTAWRWWSMRRIWGESLVWKAYKASMVQLAWENHELKRWGLE